MSRPAQALELLLDPASEELVRSRWAVLARLGLPSLSVQRSPSIRPHLTVSAVAVVLPVAEARLPALCRAALPLEVRLGPLAVLGRGPFVLAHAVLATPELLALHAAACAVLAVPDDSITAPGRWFPHVTLARRLRPAQVAAALADPGLAAPVDVRLDRARRWDAEARREWPVTSA